MPTWPGAPDGTVRITNVGTNITTPGSGNLCALIYVFEPDQQMAECCGCLITPDGLLTLSINTQPYLQSPDSRYPDRRAPLKLCLPALARVATQRNRRRSLAFALGALISKRPVL